MRDKRCTKEEMEKELFSEIKRVNKCFKNIEEFTKYVEDKRYKDEYDKNDKLSLIDTNHSSIIRRKLDIIRYKYTLGAELSELREEYLYKDEYDKNDKLSLIDTNHSSIIRRKLDIIRYKYTLGAELSELREEYLVLLEQVDKTSYNFGFRDCSVLALGILFEEGIEKFEKLIGIMDRVKKHDLMYDYIVNACGLKRKFYSDVFWDDDFEFMKEVIELAQKDKEQASKKLVYHFKINWNDSTRPYGNWLWDCAAIVKILKLDDSELKEDKEQASKKLVYHFKINWNDSTRPYGNWLWDCAAIVKILKLDDSELKDNPHYPYELAHYKNEMEFMPEKILDFPKETYKKGIPEYPRLEKLIPVKFHEITNNFLNDYKKLGYDEFCEKYELDWLEPDEYVGQEEDLETFGVNFILFLSHIGYIFQFDKLDDLEEVEFYKKFWGRKKVRPIHFQLNSDCYI